MEKLMVYDNVYLERLNTALQPLLPQWGMDENAVLRLLTFSENATFMAEDSLAARRLILRVHRPGYTPAVEINSELCWLQALRNESDISIGAPVAMQNGEYIATLRTAEIPSGILRVACAHYTATHIISPVLPQFLLRYPDLRIELDINNRPVSMVGERIDVAIRITDSPEPGAIARRVGECVSVLCASPRPYITTSKS